MQEDYQKFSENINLFLVFQLNLKKDQEPLLRYVVVKYVVNPILSWETSIEKWFLGLLPWISCLVDSQRLKTPSTNGEKYICVATTAQIILLD